MCKCPSCGVQLNINTKTWKAQSGTRQFTGSKASDLIQTYPPVKKSATQIRLMQSAAIGVACTLCAAPLTLPFPFFINATIATSAITFILSVALGKDNQEALFKLLDRNKDGKLSIKDLSTAVNAVLDRVLEPEDDTIPAPQTVMDQVQLGYEFHRRMPDGSIQYAVVLPEHPRYIGKEKLRQAARVHEINNHECNFSKRGCGEPFGDDLAQVQSELERLGYIQRTGKAANATRVWTVEGERWLDDTF